MFITKFMVKHWWFLVRCLKENINSYWVIEFFDIPCIISYHVCQGRLEIGIRIYFLGHSKKVIPAGYESLEGDVNAVLKTLTIPQADRVRNWSMGQFTRLSTSSGNILPYMVCHHIIPEMKLWPHVFQIQSQCVSFLEDRVCTGKGPQIRLSELQALREAQAALQLNIREAL